MIEVSGVRSSCETIETNLALHPIHFAFFRHVVENVESSQVLIAPGADGCGKELEFAVAGRALHDDLDERLRRVGNRVIDQVLESPGLIENALQFGLIIGELMPDDLARIVPKEMFAETTIDGEDCLIGREEHHAVGCRVEDSVGFGLRAFDFFQGFLQLLLGALPFFQFGARFVVEPRVLPRQRSQLSQTPEEFDFFFTEAALGFQVHQTDHTDDFQIGTERQANFRASPFKPRLPL